MDATFRTGMLETGRIIENIGQTLQDANSNARLDDLAEQLEVQAEMLRYHQSRVLARTTSGT